MSLLQELLEAQSQKKPKPRPKTNLWFRQPQYWLLDVQRTRPNYKIVMDDDDNRYAVDEEEEQVFGVWYTGRNQGITFFSPRQRRVVAGNRTKFKPVEGNTQ